MSVVAQRDGKRETLRGTVLPTSQHIRIVRKEKTEVQQTNLSHTQTCAQTHTHTDVPSAAGLLCQHQKMADGSSFRLKAAVETPPRTGIGVKGIRLWIDSWPAERQLRSAAFMPCHLVPPCVLLFFLHI